MSRSFWKGNFIEKKLLKKQVKKVWSRSSCIPFFLIGKRVLIYNGVVFKKLYVTREKVGYKFGDYSLTRKFTKKTKTIKNKR